MFESTSSRAASRKTLFLVGTLSWLAVVFALITQHFFDMQPCAWCIFQRMIYLLIGLVAFVSLGLMSIQSARMQQRTNSFALLACIALALGGLGVALYQFFVASKVQSCVFTLAQKFLNNTGLDQLAPNVFMATASCADAALAKLLGVPYELMSALGFIGLATIALVALLKR